MDSSLPMQVAETIQTASINRAPSPSHDLNPSTAASEKQPVSISGPEASYEKLRYEEEDDGIDIEGEEEEEDIPYGVLRPVPRRQNFAPLPDLRFEQSYLASIAEADTKWKVAYITIRDQVVLPLMQGMVWSLVLHGWRFWNRTAKLNGNTVGAKVRRWWYRTNNWTLPTWTEVSGDEKLAANLGDFYQNQSSSSAGD